MVTPERSAAWKIVADLPDPELPVVTIADLGILRDVTEDEVLANARFMAEHLAPFGWDTVVIDADWSDPDARAHGYTEEAAL